MKEIRLAEIRAEQPAGDSKALILQGVAIVYDTPTTINDPAGQYIEVIERGAEQLGWELDKLLTLTLQAMAATEDELRREIEN